MDKLGKVVNAVVVRSGYNTVNVITRDSMWAFIGNLINPWHGTALVIIDKDAKKIQCVIVSDLYYFRFIPADKINEFLDASAKNCDKASNDFLDKMPMINDIEHDTTNAKFHDWILGNLDKFGIN